jgi:lipopolysaccharide transport system ATP-binding protein
MGKTIIMVSHNIHELKTLCERTIFLENGRVGFDGSTADAEKFYMERIAEKKQRRKALREIRKMENSL